MIASDDAMTSVVVVSHNSGPFLRRCAESVLAQSAAVELIVVDNASDQDVALTLPQDARVQVLANRVNEGFAAACNRGRARARGGRLLFLNPDCELPPDAIARLAAVLAGDERIGILSAQLLNADGSPQAASRRRTPTPMRALRRALGFAHNAIEAAPAVAATATDYEAHDAVSGALMLMPHRAFDELQGFDQGYFLHCEDLDLCRRAIDAGWRVALAPGVQVLHHKGTSSRRRPIWVEWQKHRGMLRYFRKFDAAATPWWLRVAVPLGVWLRFPFAALRALARSRQR